MAINETRFFVYMLRCRDGSLYTGQTNDLEARLCLHAEGKGAKYVRGRRPFELVYVEEVDSRSEALKREMALRKLTKAQKELLVSRYRYGKGKCPTN
jgi:putative endonuclease